MIRMFRDICIAVQALHTYTAQGGARVMYEPSQVISPEEESRQDEALLSRTQQQDQSTGGQQVAVGKKGEMVPWAHRDIKPG
jgi:serine/threonine kinase 16